MQEEFAITRWEQMVEIAQRNPELKSQKQVSDLVDFYHAMLKACGCVRGQLERKGQDMFTRSLPNLHADNPEFFEKLKKVLNKATITFKEGDIELLKV